MPQPSKTTTEPHSPSASGGPPNVAATPSLALLILALGPFALGYLLSYFFRSVNAVVAPDLVRDLGLTAPELGFVTAAYLAAFATFQLPLGLLLDRYGPRRVQAALVTVGAAGALLFSLADSVATLALARAMFGVAFSGGLMAGFQAVVIWVPAPRRALANACVMSLGGLGVLFATTPIELATQLFGWRIVFVGLAAFTASVALLIYFVVPERRSDKVPERLGTQIRQMGRIYSDRVFFALAPLMASTAGTHIALQTLWAGPWFRDVAGFDRLGSANALLAMAACFVVSILLIGVIADRLARRGVSLLTAMVGFMAIFLASQVGLLFNPTDPMIALALWCLFGMTGHVAVLGYPWLVNHFGTSLSGRSNTATNLMMFSFAFLAQYGVGAVIGLFPALPNGQYDPESYRVAFGVFFAIQLLALVWYFANLRRIRAVETARPARPESGSPR
ncbi:MAG: MFS transporter [Hyphomicrobiaceae bacterium]